jgi:hypothetical protein
MRNPITLAINAARGIANDEAAGLTRWLTDGAKYGPEHAAEAALRGLRATRGDAYRRRMALARRIIARKGV